MKTKNEEIKKEESPKFELATLNANNIAELDGWKAKQSEIAKANPFIEIEDTETYEEAKKRRTALRTARTDVEKQDKTIGSALKNFRSQTIGIKEDLVAITKPLEEKQQEEVSRYEAILEEKREAKRREEEERIEKIEANIKESEYLLDGIIEKATFENIEKDGVDFKEMVGDLHQYDYEEFVGRFNEMIERKEAEMETRQADLRKAETKRVEELHRERRAKVDGLYREATEFLDGVNAKNSSTATKALTAIFKDASSFDYGEMIGEFEEMRKTFLEVKLVAKLDSLKEDVKREKMQEVNTLKETLLGEVENINKENLEVAKKQVLDLTERAEKTHGDLFQEPASAIRHALKRQVSLVEREIEADKREADLEAKRVQEENEKEAKRIAEEEAKAEKLLVERSDEIKAMGMKPSTLVYDWEGFGVNVNDDDLVGFSDAGYKDFINEIEEAKKKDEAHKARQKKLVKDKKALVKIVEGLHLPELTEAAFEHEETLDGYHGVRLSLEAFKIEMVEKVNKM